MDSIAATLKPTVKAAPDLNVLVVAHEFPDFLSDHGGVIVYFGSESPKPGLACRQLLYRHTPETADVLHAFQILKSFTPGFRVDLVFIDHNHSLEQVVAQVNAASDFTHAETVFLFDDAVPPDISMTGPLATQAWWVGEVWMLPELFGQLPRIPVSWAMGLQPTGLLVVIGLEKFSLAQIQPRYEQLKRVNSLDQLLSLLPLVPERTALHRLRVALRALAGLEARVITYSSDSRDADRSRQVEAPGDWLQPELDFVLDLSEGTADVSPLLERRSERTGKRIDTFSNVLLTGFDSFVKQDVFHSRHVEHAESEARRLVDNASYTRTILQLKEDQIFLPNHAEANAMRIDPHVFFGTPDEPDNWGMWIRYGMPSAHWFLKERGAYDLFLACLHQPWQRRLLQYLGLKPDDLMEHHLPLTYACRQLSMIRYEFRNLAVNEHERDIFREISDRQERESRGAYGERIFIARNLTGNTHHGRRLINEAELAEKLKARRFTIIQPETLDVAEQVSAFSGARMIVGTGGAAMFNTVFAKPGARVVAIESSTKWAPSHAKLFTSMGLNCGMIIGRQDLNDPEPVHKSWHVDADAAVRQIDAYLS